MDYLNHEQKNVFRILLFQALSSNLVYERLFKRRLAECSFLCARALALDGGLVSQVADRGEQGGNNPASESVSALH
jgi:hypothetical protein